MDGANFVKGAHVQHTMRLVREIIFLAVGVSFGCDSACRERPRQNVRQTHRSCRGRATALLGCLHAHAHAHALARACRVASRDLVEEHAHKLVRRSSGDCTCGGGGMRRCIWLPVSTTADECTGRHPLPCCFGVFTVFLL